MLVLSGNKMSLTLDSSYRNEYVQTKDRKIKHYGSDEYNLGLMFFENMKKYSNRVLQYIADTGESDTYGEVLKRSIRTALKLKEKGITKDDIISTCSHNHKNNVVPVIATLFIGAKTANFDPNLSHLDTIHLLKLVQPKILFVAEESLQFIEKCLRESRVKTELVVFGHSETYSQFSEYLKPNSEEDYFKPATIDDSKETAVILFSSGTTGFPKGICLNHYSLMEQLVYTELFEIGDAESENVTISHTTYYWVSAFVFLIKTVITGSAKVVTAKFDAIETWDIIEKYKLTSIFLAPYNAVEFLTHRRDADTSSLKYILTGSCPVTKKLMDDLNEAFPNAIVNNVYGQTEAGFIATFNVQNPEDVEMQIRKPLSCGKLNRRFTWKVVDPSTEEILGPNQRGELRLKSDLFMNGYYKMDSTSAYDSQGFLKTGDVVYYDEDKCFYVVDRVKEMFKYRGWHILPAVLEEVLMTHPAVKEAVVIGIPHEIDGEHPMGIVVLHEGYDDVTSDDIEQYVQDRVKETQRLRAGVKIIEKTTRTVTGKVNRNIMKKMVLDGII